MHFTEDAEQALVVDLMARALQGDMLPPIADRALDFCKLLRPLEEHRVVPADHVISHGHPTRPPLAHSVTCHQMRDRLPLTDRV